MSNATTDAMFRHRILSREEELALMTQYAKLRKKHGHDHKRTLAVRNEVVRCNMKLLALLAEKYHTNMSVEDAIGYGVEGLIRAMDTFDVKRGWRLTTYSRWWVRHYMMRAGQDLGKTVRAPVWVQDPVRRAKALQGKPMHPAREGVAMDGRGVSLDALIVHGDGGVSSRYEVTPCEEEIADGKVQVAKVSAALRMAIRSTLTEREREVVERRFGLHGDDPEILAQVGKRFHVCRERVRQLERDSLIKLRQAMGAKEAWF